MIRSKNACRIIRPILEDAEYRTYVVLSTPWAGGSMIAGLLRLANVPMGEDYDDDRNEDRELMAVSPAQHSIRSYIGKQNETKEVWGWKDPRAFQYIQDVSADLRNPYYIYVTRDATACGMRAFRERDPSTRFNLMRVIEGYCEANKTISEFLTNANPSPTLLVSYERSLRYPGNLVEELLRFTHFPDDEADRGRIKSRMIRFVEPDRTSASIQQIRKGRSDPSVTVDIPRTIRSLEQAYGHCSELANQSKFSESDALCSDIIIAIEQNYRPAPWLATIAELSDVYLAAFLFIKYICLMNLGQAVDGWKVLFRSADIMAAFSVDPDSSVFSEAMARTLENELGKAVSTVPDNYQGVVKGKLLAMATRRGSST